MPGQETESVLKLTKRPRLRPKDVSHRRSLGTSEPGIFLSPDVRASPGWTEPTSPSDASSGVHEALVGLFPSTVLASHFVVVLAFGQSRVSVPGSPHMLVSTLRLTAGAISDRDPELLSLMHGPQILDLEAVLGDYAGFFSSHAFHVTVALFPASPPVRITDRAPPNPPISLPRPIFPSSLPVTPPPITHASFLILVIFEDGSTMAPVVWNSLSVRRLCQQIGTFSNVAPDTVYLYFAGSVLDMERSMDDHPPIQAGARVYAFFSIARALRMVVKMMQGGNLPPPAVPPVSATFGPVLPPGFDRTAPPHARAPMAGPRPSPATGGSSSVSDKLRSTFKCPKFLGEVRYWKTWNQGFVRFLSINKLDHVVDEGFLTTPLTAQQHDENKFVYYILEDAVSSSTVASKYVRRAAVWNGHEAYFLLYDGFALSGPANAAILLGELSNFRCKTDETPSELVLRLQELFEDLEAVPGNAALVLNDTQKINYLLSAIRAERSLAPVYSRIQTDQVRGRISFEQACDDLRFRCEALRADDLLHSAIHPTKVRGLVAMGGSSSSDAGRESTLPRPGDTAHALITTADKRQNRGASRRKEPKEPVACLVQGCDSLTPPHLRLCKSCYHECIAGKHSTLTLKSGEKATYDVTTQRIAFPDGNKGSRPPGKPAVTFAPPPGNTGARPIVKAGVARPAGPSVPPPTSLATPLSLTFHVDSGAGQSICSCPDAFLALRPCAIEVAGVAGSLPVFGVGSAVFAVHTVTGRTVVALIHNCLLCQGSPFNLLSVSQFQSLSQNSVSFSTISPSLTMKSSHGCVGIPLVLDDGLYSFVAEPIHPSDDRNRSSSRWDMTAKTSPDTPFRLPHPGEFSSMPALAGSGSWTYKLLAGTSPEHRIMAFPVTNGTHFDAELRSFCDGFLAPVAPPPARHTYDLSNPTHMADLSARFMGTGDERLRRTVELSRGLLPTTGRVPVHSFPQGKFAQGKTPRVSKGKVHHLHRAAICEVIFMDTFETGDTKYRYGQAFVDYRSRWGDVIPLRSRTQVGWSFGEFCCRNFTPLVLVRDNISENIGGVLMQECHNRNVKSAYICPYTPQQDQAENYLERVTTMASYAMVYAGAPLFFWIWAIGAVVFISNITATYYSREQVWFTPYTVVFGEPFPDASLVVPFGCGALGLIRMTVPSSRHAVPSLLIFIHYATSHPLYTYAFYSPRTKRVLYRQDAIFLVTTFPMRAARLNSGLPADGEPLVAVRSSLASSLSASDTEYSFAQWQAGDLLPDYEDHATGIPLAVDPNFSRSDTPAFPPDWPCRYPHHPSFGPQSTVPVPIPPLFPSSPSSVSNLGSGIPLAPAFGPRDREICADRPLEGRSDPVLAGQASADSAGMHTNEPSRFSPCDRDFSPDVTLTDADAGSDADASPADSMDADDRSDEECQEFTGEHLPVGPTPMAYSVPDRDRDQSRGMGNYLRAPHAVPSSNPKRTRLNAITRESSSVVSAPVAPLPTPPVPTDAPDDVPALSRRSTRHRRLPSSGLDVPWPASIPRVPVPQRWQYVLPIDTVHSALQAHNHLPQDSLGGESPHDIMYGLLALPETCLDAVNVVSRDEVDGMALPPVPDTTAISSPL